MARIRERSKRFLRKITGRPQKQPDLPPAAEPARTTPEDPSATSRQHIQQDDVSATTPTPPAAASTSTTAEVPSATGGNHIQQEQSRDSLFATPPAPDILWNRAYDALAEENPDLVQKYEELLEKEQMANPATDEMTPPHDPDTRTDRSRLLDTVIQLGLQRMKDNKATVNIAGRKIVLEDQIAKAANILVWGSEFIGTAVKNSPEASLVWAGVSLILPLLTNGTTAAEANEDGFAYVTSRMCYYVALEPMLYRLGRSASVDDALMSKATDHLVDLYRDILDFQLSSVLRFYRNRFKVYVRDTVTSKDWNQTLVDIKTREQTVNRDLGQINGLAATQELAILNKTSEELLSGMDYCLSVAMQQLDVAKQQLAAQKDAEQARLLAEQRKCLQQFYLTSDGKGAAYDWYKGRVETRIDGTCRWFLQHENFQKWLSQESGPLLVSADPGCGKSVLAKYLVDHELAQLSATICYFFFKDQDQNTIRQALCALLHQLFTQKRTLIQHAMERYNDLGAKLVESEESLWTILRDAVRDPQAGPIIFVIDALDECVESQLSSLVTNLEKMFSDQQLAGAKFRVLMTSRPYPHVVNEFYNLQEVFRHIHIPGEEHFEAISQEINSVIQHRVNQLAKKYRLSDKIISSLNSKLLAIDHRTYLWVYLVFDYLDTRLNRGFNKPEDEIDAAIRALPKSVNQAYDQILNRYQDDETVNTVRKILSIILAARRPFSLTEMNIAMTLNGEGRGQSIYSLDLDQDASFKSRLRALCGLFVHVHHDKIYFLHQTAREFLLQSSTPTTVSSDLQWYHSITTRHAHSVLAEICMLYLDKLNSTDADTFSESDHHGALLDYSDDYWDDHFREAEFEKGSALVDLATGLCTPDVTCKSQWASICQRRYYIGPEPATNALVASHFGLTPVIKLLLKMGADIEAKDSSGQTALMNATGSGHEAVTRLLLENGANTNVKTKTGRTALMQAAIIGHEAITRLLLENGADIEARDNSGRTALMEAALIGHKLVTRLLLEKQADVEAKDIMGTTALVIAAEYGHEADTRLLLKNGANIDAKNTDGRTALMHAAKSGHEVVTQLLLENGANVEARDDNGMTALIHAANTGHEHHTPSSLDWFSSFFKRISAVRQQVQPGHEAVTRLLLDNGADVEAKDNWGWTATMHAAKSAHEAIVRLLLGSGADIEAKDNDGRTALGHATETVKQLLLDHGALVDALDVEE